MPLIKAKSELGKGKLVNRNCRYKAYSSIGVSFCRFPLTNAVESYLLARLFLNYFRLPVVPFVPPRYYVYVPFLNNFDKNTIVRVKQNNHFVPSNTKKKQNICFHEMYMFWGNNWQ